MCTQQCSGFAAWEKGRVKSDSTATRTLDTQRSREAENEWSRLEHRMGNRKYGARKRELAALNGITVETQNEREVRETRRERDTKDVSSYVWCLQRRR
jgi:hypothetical protein